MLRCLLLCALIPGCSISLSSDPPGNDAGELGDAAELEWLEGWSHRIPIVIEPPDWFLYEAATADANFAIPLPVEEAPVADR